MTLHVRCPYCKGSFRVPAEDMNGWYSPCPDCGMTLSDSYGQLPEKKEVENENKDHHAA